MHTNTENQEETKGTSKKPEKPECLVWGALAFTLRISRWFGIAPLRFERKRDGIHISISRIMYIYSCLMVLVTNTAMVIIIAMYQMGEEQSKYSICWKSFCLVHAVLCGSLIAITCAAAYFARKRIKITISVLNEINMIISELSNKRPQLSSEWKKFAEMSFSLLGLVVLIILDIYGHINYYYHTKHFQPNSSHIPMYMFIFFNFYTTMLLEMQFKFTAASLVTPMEIINDVLRSLNHSACYDSYLSIHRIHKLQDTIRRLILSYTKVCDGVRRIDEYYGTLLLILIIFYLPRLLLGPYQFVLVLLTPDEEPVLVAIQLCWCVYHFANVMLLIEPSHRTQEEITKTRALVSSLKGLLTDPLLSAELELFYQTIVLNKAEYTPLGIFVLKRPLVAQICSVCVTYLVIILQFNR